MSKAETLTGTTREQLILGVRRTLAEIDTGKGPAQECDREAVRAAACRLLGVRPAAERLIRRAGMSILCLRCFWESHNPNDVTHRYCGHCKTFARPIAAAVEEEEASGH